MSPSYPNEIFSVFSFLGFIMCMIPIPWHLRAWNSGTLLYIFWAGIGCLIYFVNSIVWKENAIDWSPIWCDISSRFIVGGSLGLPAASLCINRRLYLLQHDPRKNAAETKKQKMRMIMIDLSIGLGLPILHMILFYINQGHRYNILEDIGCWPATYYSWIAIVITYLPTLLVGLITGYYSIRTIISINRRRTEFNDLISNQLNVTSGLYSRLIALAAIEAFCTVPLATFFLIYNTNAGVRPWISWENTHIYFDRADQVPAIIWRRLPVADGVELNRWLYVVCAFVFFGFFGFAEEARLNYRLAIRFVLKRLGLRTRRRQTDILTFQAAPNDKNPKGEFAYGDKRHDSLSSIGTISTMSDMAERGDARFSISSLTNSANHAADRSKKDQIVGGAGDRSDSTTMALDIAVPPVAFIPSESSCHRAAGAD